MTKEEYLKFHKDCCDKLITITKAKNSDYTGKSDDPFKNFRICQTNGACTVEQGFVVRMSDKLSRIISLTIDNNKQQVMDERVEDTLLDLANYCILLAGYLKEKQSQEPAPGSLTYVSSDYFLKR
jgi:hypothetical protein